MHNQSVFNLFLFFGTLAAPVTAFAAQGDPSEATQISVNLFFLALVCWGIYKCFAITGRKTTNAKCVVALAITLMGYLIIHSGTLIRQHIPNLQVLVIIAVGLGFVFFIISYVLAIIGLVEYKQGFKQGRKQAVWALVINSLFVFVVAAATIKGVVHKIEQEKSIYAQFDSGIEIKNDDLNYMMTNPDKPFVKIKPETVNPYASVAFVRSKPQIFYMLIAERVGIDMEMKTEDLVEISQAALKSSAQSCDIGEAESVTINSMDGLQFITHAQVSGRKVSYVYWVCSNNGYLYQQIAFSGRKNIAPLLKASDYLFHRFKQIEPDKVAYSEGSDPYNDYASEQFGYSLELRNTSWSKFPELNKKFPGADTGGITGNEVAAFFVSVLPIGSKKAGDDAIVGAFLQSLSIERDDKKLSLLSHETKNAATDNAANRFIFAYTDSDGGEVADYKLKISILKDRALLLAVWSDKEISTVDKYFRQVDAAMEIRPIDETIDAKILDEHGKKVVADTLNRMGIFFDNRNNYKEATTYYKAAIAHDSGDQIIWDNLLRCLNQRKAHEEAASFIKTYENKCEFNTANRSWYAWHLGHGNNKEGAIKVYEKLFSSDYQNEEDFKYYTKLLGELGKSENIDTAFDRYLNGRKNIDLRIYQADIWYGLKQFEKALAILDKLDMASPTVALKKIYNLQALDRFKEGLSICEQLIGKNEFVGEAFYYKGVSEYHLKWYAKAKISFEKSQEKFPKDNDIKAYLKELSGILGQGDNSAIKKKIKPVPLPRNMDALMNETIDPEYVEGESAYFLRRHSGYAWAPDGSLKYTIRRTVHIVNSTGANNFSTYTIDFNPLYEQLFVNKLLVRDPHGKVIANGDQNNYYIVDLNKDDEKSHEQTLNMPIPQLSPGCSFEIVATKTIGNFDDFPFKKKIMSTRYPVISSMVYVVGDTAKVQMKGVNGVRIKSFGKEKIAYVHSPLKYRHEPNQIDYHSYMPLVYINGMNKDWASQGNEYLEMIQKQMVITDDIKKMSRSLIHDVDGQDQKIAKIYGYLQEHYKYMGIEFGSRGQIPYEASKTVRNKYGDCKDHAILLHHLLESAGIPNYLAVVNSSHSIQADMPSRSQFNHIINFIPGSTHQFWDATDKTVSVNLKTPTNLGGRQALLLEPEKVRLVRIPDYMPEDTRIRVNRKFKIKEKVLLVEETLELGGYYGAFMRSFLKRKNADDRHGWGQATIQSYFPSGKLENIRLLNAHNNNIPLTILFNYSVLRKIHPVEKGLIVNAGGIWEPYYLFSEPVKKRSTAFEVEYPFVMVSRNVFDIPDGYVANRLPWKITTAETDFGTYAVTHALGKGKIEFHLKVTAKSGKFPKSQYKAYYQFNQNIIEAASPTLTLTRSQ